jgi:catechol 2,3-dioxygenase-like lactoylglutathione lyase family enzyme
MELNQITVPCADYEQSVQFYRRLGLRQIVDSPPKYARFETESGATFSLHKAERKADAPDVVIYFEVADVDAHVRGLEDAGFTFEGAPKDQAWLWREAYLRDPAGNLLCIYHAGENRRFPPWRISENAV